MPAVADPRAGGERKPVAGPRDEGRHFYDGPSSPVARRLQQRLPVRFPEGSVTAHRARACSFPNFLVVVLGGGLIVCVVSVQRTVACTR